VIQVRQQVVLADTSGTTRRRRLEVQAVDGRTRAVFVKTPSASMLPRMVVALGGLGRAEVGFYRDAAPAVPLVVTGCLQAQASLGSFRLVLDDLVTAGATTFRLGHELPMGVIEEALAALALLHSTFWNDPRLASREWSWCRSFVPAGEATLGWLLAPALAAVGRRRVVPALPDAVGRGLARYARLRTLVLRRLDHGPRTLLHHDCHPGNMAQLPDGRVVLFDWQLVRAGPWASDVAYLLATSLSADERRTHERRLLEHYLDALVGAGGRPPAVADAWQAYVANLVYPLEAMVVTLAFGAMQPPAAVRRVIERAAAAVVDHDAFALL
jgi:Phosphotransferase enzyme family